MSLKAPKQLNLSVVIPTFNEERVIKNNLQKVLNFLRANTGKFEVLVVDDGSKDQTPAILTRLAAGEPGLTFIANKKNRGKGAVVRQGLERTRYRYALFLDADLSTDITALNNWPGLNNRDPDVDIWISSRYLKKSRIVIKQPLKRRLIGRAANIGIRTFFLPGIKDTQNGLKIFRRGTLERILPKLRLQGWFFDVELLYVAKKSGLKIREFPITWTNRGDSRLHIARDIKKTWPEVRLFVSNVITKKYDRPINKRGQEINSARHKKII